MSSPFSSTRAILERALPRPVLDALRRARLDRLRAANACRPLAEVFSDIYARRQWGSADREFFSGDGSTETQVSAYVALVRDFVQRRRIRTVLDLGCGDYAVGRRLRMPGVRYLGVDVVPALVAHHQRAFRDAETDFVCADILRDELPRADLCLIRQVFQHLSNGEIQQALERVSGHRFTLVTEHFPAPDRWVGPNLDKPHGPDTRVLDGSAVCVGAPPFSRPAQLVLASPIERPLVSAGETLQTFLLG